MVNFLNEPARQGPGEATVTPRDNGSAGLLWLEPGSLGDTPRRPGSTRTSLARRRTGGPGFVNASPRQGAGEASGFVRNDGSAVIFYLEPGSGG